MSDVRCQKIAKACSKGEPRMHFGRIKVVRCQMSEDRKGMQQRRATDALW